MPINYQNYPPNWKSEIRPRILARAGNKCEFCGIPNGKVIIRGTYNGFECYQDETGDIFNAGTSEKIGTDYLGNINEFNEDKNATKIVLTIAHLNNKADVSIEPPDEELAALCQRCHNRLDAPHRKQRRKNKNQYNLNFEQ